MKIYWSTMLLLSLLALIASCGQEQFGTIPQSMNPNPDPLVVNNQVSCSQRTLINPIVDVLYVVDNSTSNNYISSDVKTGIQNTINTISSEFDYRIIGTPLLATAGGNNDFQVLAKNPSSLPAAITAQKTVTSSSQFTFFSNQVSGSAEPGLDRVRGFISAHQSDGLFRQGAYLFVVLVSNGYDTDIETMTNVNGQTGYTTNGLDNYAARKASLLQLKSYLNSQQFRLFSVVPHTPCQSGWRAATRSYMQMSKDLYNSDSNLTDQETRTTPDSYNLCLKTSTLSCDGQLNMTNPGCNGFCEKNPTHVSCNIFNSINATIKQVIIPHKYKYWPITFTETTSGLDLNSIKVFKNGPNSAPVQMTSGWSYLHNPTNTPFNTRIEPTPEGEPTTAKHLIQFDAGNEIVYPNCVQITSTSNLEYFQYIVINKIPKMDSVVLKVRNTVIPQSSTNGWSYEGYKFDTNIKVNYDGYSDLPEAKRTGYFIKLNGSENYYKSGDSVVIDYIPKTN